VYFKAAPELPPNFQQEGQTGEKTETIKTFLPHACTAAIQNGGADIHHENHSNAWSENKAFQKLSTMR
jgi:hypothetical protein